MGKEEPVLGLWAQSPVHFPLMGQLRLEELGALYVIMSSYAEAGPTLGLGQNPSGLSA